MIDIADSNITKNALAASVKKLMKEKSFQKISVSDICKECGMNRKSFYYHFKDKYDLVNWIFYVDFIGKINIKSYEDVWDFFYDVCEHLYNERDFYRNALEFDGQNSFKEYFIEILNPILLLFFQDVLKKSVDQEFFITFFCESTLISILRWIKEGVEIPPDKFLDTFHSIIVRLAEKVVKENQVTH